MELLLWIGAGIVGFVCIVFGYVAWKLKDFEDDWNW